MSVPLSYFFHAVSNATPMQTVPRIASATSRFPVRASCSVLTIFAGFGERGGPEEPPPRSRGDGMKGVAVDEGVGEAGVR